MKVQIVLSLVASACIAVSSESVNTPYSKIAEHHIPLGEKIRIAEERMLQSRVVGGDPAIRGEFPYQCGALTRYFSISGIGVSGCAIISTNRVVSCASFWNDGVHQARGVTVVAGSLRLFDGGVRIESTVVALHPQYNPSNPLSQDVGVIYLPTPLVYSNFISPIALPDDDELSRTFNGETCLFSGFGVTQDGQQITEQASLYRVTLSVISNTVCHVTFPLLIQSHHLCTSGSGGVGPCQGDAGSPLAIQAKGRPLLVAISSFISSRGCQDEAAAGFIRTTAVIDFLRRHAN